MSVNKSQYVVHSGYISLRNKLKLGYQVLWCALVRENAAGPKRIVFYDTSDKFVTDVRPQLSLEFKNIVHVQLLEVKVRAKIKMLYQFQIITTSGKHVFATKTAEECQQWMEKITNMLQGIPEPGVVYEFQVVMLPGGHADKLNLCGSYILKVSDSSLELFTANGALPTHFHCSLSSISSVQCTPVCINVCGSKTGLVVIQTSSDADVGEGSLTFSTKSSADINRMIEYRRNLLVKASHKVLRASQSLQVLVSDQANATSRGLSHSENFYPPTVPLPYTGASLHKFHPSSPKPQRMSVPNLSDSLQDSTYVNSFISGNSGIPEAPSKCLKSTNPPKPLHKPRSANPSRGWPQTDNVLSPCSHFNMPDCGSNKHISVDKTPSSALTDQSNSTHTKVFPPIPHHLKLKHSNSKVSAKHLLPPLTPPPPQPTTATTTKATTTKATTTKATKIVTRYRVGQQGIGKFPHATAMEGSKDEAGRERAMYLSKSTGDLESCDFETIDSWLGNRKPPAVRMSSVDVLLQEELTNDNDVAYQPLIAFQGNQSQETTDDAPYLSLRVPLQGNKSQETTDNSPYLSLVPLQGNKSQGTTEIDSPSYLVLSGSMSQESRSGGVEKTSQNGGKVGSNDGDYTNELSPCKLKSMAKFSKSDSDLLSQGAVVRNGAIKVHKDSLDTISTQRQLSTEDLTSMHNHSSSPQSYVNHDQYPCSEHSGGVKPYATFTDKYQVGEGEFLPYSVFYSTMDPVTSTSSQPTLADDWECEDAVPSEDYDYVRSTSIYRLSPREELGTYLGVTTPEQEQSTRDTTCDSPKEVNRGRQHPQSPLLLPQPPEPLPYETWRPQRNQ